MTTSTARVRPLQGRRRGPRARTTVLGAIPAGVMILLLAVQYLTGQAVSLFVHTPPLPSPGTQAMTAASMMRVAFTLGRDGVLLGTHMFLGITVGALSLAAVVAAAFSGSARALLWSMVSAAAVVISGAAGMSFVMSGQHSRASAIMAAGFLVAFAASFFQLLAARRCR